MKRTRQIFLAITFSIVALSCEKDSQPIPPPEPEIKFMLKSMVWKDLNVAANLTYNTDSTIKRIYYGGNNISNGVSFIYREKNILEMNAEPGIYKNIFTYDNNGRIHKMTRYIKEGSERPTQQLEFSYDQNNNVSMLKYFDINEAGSKLVYTNTYEFDQARRPIKITAVDNAGNKSITSITGYSEDISFDPLYFTGVEIEENYALYNYPVLSRLKQLPTGIRKTRIIAGQTTLEKEITFTYSLTGQRLDKQISKQHDPMFPQLDKQVEVNFNY